MAAARRAARPPSSMLGRSSAVSATCSPAGPPTPSTRGTPSTRVRRVRRSPGPGRRPAAPSRPGSGRGRAGNLSVAAHRPRHPRDIEALSRPDAGEMAARMQGERKYRRGGAPHARASATWPPEFTASGSRVPRPPVAVAHRPAADRDRHRAVERTLPRREAIGAQRQPPAGPRGPNAAHPPRLRSSRRLRGARPAADLVSATRPHVAIPNFTASGSARRCRAPPGPRCHAYYRSSDGMRHRPADSRVARLIDGPWGCAKTIGQVSFLVTLIAAANRLMARPAPPKRGLAAQEYCPDQLFSKVLVLIIVRNLHQIQELLPVLDQSTAEMAQPRSPPGAARRPLPDAPGLRATDGGAAGLPPGADRRPQAAVSDGVPPRFACGRAVAIGSTTRHARGGVEPKKGHVAGVARATATQTRSSRSAAQNCRWQARSALYRE